MLTQVVLGAITWAFWLAAEVLRSSHPAAATLASMGAWITFLVQVVVWAREGTTWRDFAGRVARVSGLMTVSLGVLLLYYLRSGVEEAGIHVDAVYTYVGLQWFLELHNPITFGGSTYSYPQFPLALLSHFPAVTLGFDRLGPFAMNLGVMLTIGFLFAIMTVRFVRAGAGSRLATAALASAVFSNRMLVQSYHMVGYTVPAVCLGLMLLVVVDYETFPRPQRMIGGLLALAVLHHLPGVMLVAPVAAAWLIVRQHPIAELRRFLRANPVLLTIAGAFLITLSVAPDLLVHRVRDITVGPTGSTLPPLVTKMHQHWTYLTTAYPGEWMRSFVLDSPGSWYLVNLAPLGGFELPILGATWLCSGIALPGGAWRYALYLGALAGLLLSLSTLQHLLTDFNDYRDYTMVFALTVAGFLFVFRASRLWGRRKLAAWGLAVAIALHNFVDLGRLHGRTHPSADYSARSQAVMERVRSLSRQLGAQPFGASRAYVVLENSFFSMEKLYLEAFRRQGLTVTVVRESEYCKSKSAAIEKAAAQGCEAFLWFESAAACQHSQENSAVLGTLYGSACEGTAHASQRTTRPVGG